MKLQFNRVRFFFERLFEGYGKDKTRANNKQVNDDDDLNDAAKGAKSHSLRQPHRDGQDVDARNESGPSHGKLTKEQKVVQRGANKRDASQSWIFVGRLQMIQYYVSSVWGMRVFVLYCKNFLVRCRFTHEIFVYLAAKAQHS